MDVLDRFSLDGRVAVVTGGTRGLGEGFARALGQAGASVVIAGRDADEARRVSSDLKDAGVENLFVRADITRPDEVGTMLSATLEHFGQVDILVNNAGACVHAPALEVTAEDWRTVMDVNLDARVALLPDLRTRTSSTSAPASSSTSARCPGSSSTGRSGSRPTTPRRPPCITSPAAWPPNGHRSACGSTRWRPGYIKTDMSPVDDPQFRRNWIEDAPMRRYGTVEELAPAVVFLASDASSFVTGSVLVADGGYTVF